MPHLGGVQVGKLSTPMIREWRATLLANGVSVSTAAKAYRFLRAVLMTAAEEDKILPRNPCRIRGAGDEDAPERPVLAVAQVFELADWWAAARSATSASCPTEPTGFALPATARCEPPPEIYLSRADAERALWKMIDGRADCTHDRRYRALVLLATFASLRWGEATALRRCDVDLDAATVRVRTAYIERSTGEMLLGPPKSKAGRRVVGIPDAIIPALREHLSVFVRDEPGRALLRGPEGRAAAARQLQ